MNTFPCDTTAGDMPTQQKGSAMPQVTSERSPVEITPPVGSLGVVGGSLPVSSADISDVVAMLERRAEKFYDPDNKPEENRYVDALHYCANVLNRHAFDLRRHMAAATERQPEENVRNLPRDT